MSATTELLLKEIEKNEKDLQACKLRGDVETALKLSENLKVLKERLTRANEALNEGKQILKG